ncbi:style cell-cycle inhibitor 1-A [Silene latifolia]|uniref:style cell-cycle inhibitor 1-A n=1 Tax=Silene latifolia TaxID=37657 RepID=UPI003D7805E0
MMSDRKTKDKSRKRSSDSQSEDESKAKKKHRSREEDGEGSKKTKSHKDSETRSRKEKKHRSKDSKQGGHSNVKVTELSNEDYYSKNNEFATWLKEEKKKFFSDLSTDTARELFSEFIEEWNTRKLKSKFYKGITTGPRSSHKWKIKD